MGAIAMMLSKGAGGGGGGATPILPTSIANLFAWYKRGDFYSDNGTTLQTTNGGAVQQWSDSSGLGHHLNRTSNRPTLDTGTTHLTKPTLRFDPSGGFKALDFPTYSTTDGEYFLVAKAASDAPSVDRCVWELGGGSGTTLPTTTDHILEGFGDHSNDCGAHTIADAFHVLNTGIDSSQIQEVRLDNTLISNVNVGSHTISASGFLGTNGATTHPWDGWVFEIVIFSAKLSSSDRAGLYAYLTS